MMPRLLLAAALLATGASARTRAFPDPLLAPFASCRAMTDAQARAQCYDAAFDRLRTVPPARAIPANEIQTRVASVIAYGGDMWGIRTAEGTLWRTTRPGLGGAPAIGAPVRIRAGMVGGRVLQVGRGPKVHVAEAGARR